MHIVNIMFARGGGGIEQASVDYCQGLKERGHQVTAVVYPGAVVHHQLLQLSVPTITLRNVSEWDIIAMLRLRRRLKALKPDIVIAHANRAYRLSKWAARGVCPLVGVAQNYSTRRFRGAQAMFTTTHDLVRHLTEREKIPPQRIFLIPNMVACHALPQREGRNRPPVIGTMGRFVAKKGFDVYIEALRRLKERNYQFKAVLGGDGAEAAALKKQARDAGLEDILTFSGWVQDKRVFYTHIDIFCLPSLHEPFGIVLLEAFVHGAPVVSTDSEGPRDFITPNYDALVVPKGEAAPLADALAKLLDDEKLAADLAANAFVKVKTRYATDVVAEKIEEALVEIIRHREAA